jgi:hydrogenase/urease accessory protein HupE
MLNGGFAAYNGGLAAAQAFGLISASEVDARTIVYAAGQNAMLMEDEYLTDLSALGLPSWRQTTMNDKIVLPAIGLIGTAVGGNPTQINGVSVPLADNIVLSSNEIAEVRARVIEYNATIETLTAQQGWALYDAYGILNQAVVQGVAFDDYVMTTDLVTGGFFSLDGIHTTARGSALIANGMMEAIDAHYGSNLSDAAVKAGDYPTNYSPDLR